MKTILISALIFFAASICGYSQVWQQTAGTPEGSGVTEMVVRQSNGHIFVTTGSTDPWPSGDLGGVRRSTDDGATWENLNDVFIARTIIDGAMGIYMRASGQSHRMRVYTAQPITVLIGEHHWLQYQTAIIFSQLH